MIFQSGDRIEVVHTDGGAFWSDPADEIQDYVGLRGEVRFHGPNGVAVLLDGCLQRPLVYFTPDELWRLSLLELMAEAAI